ncbi:DUF2911 domain-containing protein [Psychroflexus aestuariivivens]|uniref:DUF2911 domain-containing protein n=1 Tax=Psychroflexus aestuariivivens TaxID=1795040 RepID=UPI000FDB1946|nr:DUF2911 domain-containing protein [Psychroflexus aestuariivivens]
MKFKIFLFFLSLSFSVIAQIETPQPSPNINITQIVGLSEVGLAYSRPSAKGREIFGNLVPYGKKWRTGANENTIITFSDDVVINEQTLEAGSYAVFTVPNKEAWDVYFYDSVDSWGLPKMWEEDMIAASITVPTRTIDHHVETFTVMIGAININKAHLQISWENTLVEVPIHFPTDLLVSENIDKVMNGPSASDYYSAAVYYKEAGKDIEKSVEWIEKAMEMMDEKPFWMLRQQSLIYAKAGKKQQAISAAKASLAGAKKANNEDYIKMNQNSLKEWGAM